ncbi:hypothetical protein [Pseudomonas mandelii]|uniref:hypothetical protein n=1 Tax=Pseudomonas mandelii TaxID=75612 RepID=UPI00224B04B5|nr:hypothetical protein [Pseudomonas mandelii]MCX2897802.1 hypothetical protein [Pseudomonas mandelii]
MKNIILLVCVLFSPVALFASATSFGFFGRADILSVNGVPAICSPSDASAPLQVGAVTVSESYVRNPGSWGIALKDGAVPLALKPGECIAFESVPEGYEVDKYTTKVPRLKLEVNKTYLFAISDAYKTRDTYTGTFCVSRKADGRLEYREYTRLNDGARLIPSCDTLKHRKSSLNIAPWEE